MVNGTPATNFEKDKVLTVKSSLLIWKWLFLGPPFTALQELWNEDRISKKDPMMTEIYGKTHGDSDSPFKNEQTKPKSHFQKLVIKV